MLAQVYINKTSDILVVRRSFHHCSLHYYLSPQLGLVMRRKLRFPTLK